MDTTTRFLGSPIARLVRYCAACHATSTFVWMDEPNGWACIGNPTSRREGCGKRLGPFSAVPLNLSEHLPRPCHASFISSHY